MRIAGRIVGVQSTEQSVGIIVGGGTIHEQSKDDQPARTQGTLAG